jgi:predicted metal-dependent hydrolase
VALEHFTAVMAEDLLTGPWADEMPPAVRDLLRWHAAEEIEHKAVAFDVLKIVNPSYAIRMVGLVSGSISLAAFWLAATSMLLWQDRVPLRVVISETRRIQKLHPIGRRVFWKGIRDYVRRDFHPWDHDNRHLAEAAIAGLGGLDAR